MYLANQTNPNTRISCNQVFPHAFFSPDLVHWTKHPRLFDTARVKWARRVMWDPAVTEKNGKYYLVNGGRAHFNFARLNDDITGSVPFVNVSTFRSITPEE